ncbi:MAG TPA: phosphatidate cytidylyltransferase, partial [Rhodocyclaceae bacterium]|nr:phosphatidate cytidylyltransferase [Rhodocyclaceae bacterium]
MLKTRILTAIVILAVFVPGLFFLPQFAWAVLMAVLASVAGWEWGRFMRLSAAACVGVGTLIGGLCLLLLGLNPEMVGAGSAPATSDALPL